MRGSTELLVTVCGFCSATAFLQPSYSRVSFRPVRLFAEKELSSDAQDDTRVNRNDSSSSIANSKLFRDVGEEESELVRSLVDEINIPRDELESTQEDVQAVLAASSEAMFAAEEMILQQPLANTTTGGTSLTPNEVPKILPAATVVGEPITATEFEAPSTLKILKFAIPAIGVWLCNPLLNLIDTSAVGLFAGTVEQAALNPAVAVTHYASLLIAFMYTGTTNLVAAAQESDRGTPGKPRTTKTFIGAMRLSTYIGAGLGSVLFVFSRPLLNAIVGNAAISPAVFAAAMKYVRIRALGMPAAAIIGSTQAACLGMQDIKSPLYVLVAAAVVNFVGDIALVTQKNAWLGGAAGAAWATVISQYAALALFVRWLTHKPSDAMAPKVVNLSKPILELTSSKFDNREGGSKRKFKFRAALRSRGQQLRPLDNGAAPTSKTQKPIFSARGFLQDKLKPSDLLVPPNAHTREEFKPYFIPVTTTQMGRVSGHVAMSHVVASTFGTAAMAAHQVLVSLFYCVTPIADSLSLTAQSFVPQISERKASHAKAKAIRRIGTSFGQASLVFGGSMMAAVSSIPLFSGWFTLDSNVMALVNSVAPSLSLFFGLHGILCAAEGVLLGQKDLGFLGKMYGSFFFILPYFMLRLKKEALAGGHVSLKSVWDVFVFYQGIRSILWVGRVWMLQRKAFRDAAESPDMITDDPASIARP